MRRLGIGSSIGLLLLGAILLQLTILVFVGITIAARGVDYAAAVRAVQTDPLPLGASQLAALGAVIGFGVYLGAPGQQPATALGVVPTKTRWVIAAAIAGLGLQLPLVELTTLLARAIPALQDPPEVDALITALTRIDSPLRAVSVPFTFVVIAPVTEELLFRGLIQRALRERHGPGIAIAVSSVLFGAFHFHLSALFFATLVGVILGVIAERSKSTMPGIALHAGFNAVPVLLPRALFEIQGFNVDAHDDVPLPLVIGSALLAIAALSVLAIMLRSSTQRAE